MLALNRLARLPAPERVWGALAGIVLALAVLGASGTGCAQTLPDDDAIARGKYLFDAGGCATCHTDRKNKGPLLGGGGPLETSFGTFYPPNISPDPRYGIGKWTDADFIRAMRDGIAPDGSNYYPAFPYTSFTMVTDRDLRDLKAYIFSLPPVAKPSHPHELRFPFNFRFLIALWKALYFRPGPFQSDPTRSQEWNRGAYLATGLLHCAECHTPRTMLGGLDRARWMAGGPNPTGKGQVPNITPSSQGIGSWSVDDIITALSTGMTPDGDFLGAQMADVVEFSTSKLTEADRGAVAAYLKSLPPFPPGGKTPQ